MAIRRADEHRVNTAERAIQTYKNHMVSGLSTTDVDFPLQLWDKLTEQALITLNIVRTSRIDPSKSAYHQLHGHRYNWNKYPMAPPGTRAIILVDPTTRESWGTRGIDAWYVGPSFDHYRNCIFLFLKRWPTALLPPLNSSHNIASSQILRQQRMRQRFAAN